MNTRVSPYDALYNNLKNRFTVIHCGKECTVGDYMRMKSGTECTRSLPSVRKIEDRSITAVINYVNDKLTMKKAPVKDRTMRRFPIRTSFSATLSAVAACAIIMFTGVIAAKVTENSLLPSANTPTVEEMDELPAENNLDSYPELYKER